RRASRSARRPVPTSSTNPIPAVARTTTATSTSRSTTPRSFRIGDSGEWINVRPNGMAVREKPYAERRTGCARMNRLYTRSFEHEDLLRFPWRPERRDRQARDSKHHAKQREDHEQLEQRDSMSTHGNSRDATSTPPGAAPLR